MIPRISDFEEGRLRNKVRDKLSALYGVTKHGKAQSKTLAALIQDHAICAGRDALEVMLNFMDGKFTTREREVTTITRTTATGRDPSIKAGRVFKTPPAILNNLDRINKGQPPLMHISAAASFTSIWRD